MDVEEKMAIGEKQFARACNAMGFRGNVVALWKYLDTDRSGHISILELDPQCAILLASLKSVVQKHFKDSSQLAFQHWDEHHSDHVSKDTFIKSVRHWTSHEPSLAPGLTVAQATRLFGMLDRNHMGFLTSKDVAFLDKWTPVPYLFTRADESGLQAFKESIIYAYGSMLRAWRMLLDKDGIMRVSWPHFCEACRSVIKIGADGTWSVEEMAGVWRALDNDCSGWIALQEFDEESYVALAEFRRWASQSYGSVLKAFHEMAGRNAKLTAAELRRAYGGVNESWADVIINGLNINENFHIYNTRW
eukprot:392914-Amphidinium_carterae.1